MLGTEPTDGACDAVAGPATRTVPLSFSGQGSFAVEVFFGGFSNEFAYVVGPNTVGLDSVRTITARLGPR